MTTSKRGPGRPRGSGINDGRELDAVADLCVREPKLKKTPAISRVVQERHPDRQRQWSAIERRLLRKWNMDPDKRLAAAREREEERRRRTCRPTPHYDPSRATTALAAIEHCSALQRALEATGSISRLMDSFGAAGIAGSAVLHFESMAAQEAMRSIREDAARWASISGVARAATEHLEATAAYGAMYRIQDEAERMRRLYDPLGSARGAYGL